MMRAAVYTEIEKQFKDSDRDANFVILAVSKQDPPDKAAMLLNHRQRYDFELEQIEKRMPRIISVLTKRVKPKRCGACEYCRGTTVGHNRAPANAKVSMGVNRPAFADLLVQAVAYYKEAKA